MSKAGKKSGKKGIEKVEPAHALSPFEEMERFFEGALPRGWMRRMGWGFPEWAETHLPFEGRMPKVDVIERDDAIVVRAELPGVDKKDLDVSLTESTVTIKGSTRHEEKEEKGDYYRSEISSGSFSRTLALPNNVDAENAKAKMKDGVLELTLPKKEASKRRSVEVED